jgi:hypothetical protein
MSPDQSKAVGIVFAIGMALLVLVMMLSGCKQPLSSVPPPYKCEDLQDFGCQSSAAQVTTQEHQPAPLPTTRN